jgi:hypothetical protein
MKMAALYTVHGTYEDVMANQPEWTTIKDVMVLRVKDRPFVAVPHSGRKNSRVFHIIDIEKGKEVCQLQRQEVAG